MTLFYAHLENKCFLLVCKFLSVNSELQIGPRSAQLVHTLHHDARLVRNENTIIILCIQLLTLEFKTTYNTYTHTNLRGRRYIDQLSLQNLQRRITVAKR